MMPSSVANTMPPKTVVPASQSRKIFWDFLKNLALAGVFLVLAFGPSPNRFNNFIDHPFSSSHPYNLD